MYFLEESYKHNAKNSNFENFESALYMKSASMPLSKQKNEKYKNKYLLLASYRGKCY